MTMKSQQPKIYGMCQKEIAIKAYLKKQQNDKYNLTLQLEQLEKED